jgi:Transglycosylase SLT domain
MARNKLTEKQPQPKAPTEYHPWRLCPAGQHWVRDHSMRVPQSENHPDGRTVRHGHCHGNKSHRDQIYPDEMREIADLYFSKLTGPPNPSNLGYKHGNDFDALIRGWTTYWNEILKPETPLDPNLIKALIATESSFHPAEDNKLKGDKRALGLTQITNSTRKTLADEKGELKDRLVNVKEKDAFDPNLNIAAGIRWLFQKKKLASHRLKKEATWEEAVAEYKDFLRDLRSLEKLEKGKKMTKRQAEAKRQMEKFHRFYQELAK